MKKSNITNYILYLAIFAAVACYLGVSWYRSVSNPFSTELAVDYSIEESLTVEGLVIREEQLLSSEYSILDVEAEEGEKLAVGEAVACAYGSEEQLSASAEMRSLERRIEQLESVMLGSDADIVSDSDVMETVYAISASVNSGDLTELTKQTAELKTAVFSREFRADSSAATEELLTLKAELDSLTARTGSVSKRIYTDVSGVYSSHTDGQESLSPDILDELDPASLRRLMAQKGSVPTGTYGKLMTGVRWYYAALIDEQAAAELSLHEGDTVRLRFTRDLGGVLRLGVESVGREAVDGQRLIIFSSNRDLEAVAGLRAQQAEIIVNTYEGVRVSKDALHLTEDGEPCVYIVYGLQARQVPITLIYEGSDYCIVKSADGSTLLSEGSEVIVSAKGLYDGKVIGQ